MHLVLLLNIQIFKKEMKQTYCLGGHHYSNTNNLVENEKVNPKTKKLVKVIKSTCSFCGKNISQVLLIK